jgi:hypothetical protein
VTDPPIMDEAHREPGHYWVILEEGALPEIAHWDGDDWFAVGREEAVELKAMLGERLPEPAEAS